MYPQHLACDHRRKNKSVACRHGLHITYLVLSRKSVALDLSGPVGVSMLVDADQDNDSTNLQASQAVFCFLGGGRVFTNSWI
jgi:hypothetical protein